MTQTEPHTLACPACGNATTAPLSDGLRFCTECRHEWNPADPTPLRAVPDPVPSGPPVPVTAPVPAQPSTGAVTDPPDPDDARNVTQTDTDDVTAGVTLEALVGTDVVLEGGQRATLVSFPDDDHAEVVITHDDGTERLELVGLNDVERSVSAPVPVIDVPAPTAIAIARVNMTVAALVLRAGVASIAGEYPDAELLTPPTGWLPLDAEGLPALEQGTAYAVAFLIHAFSIDREQVGAIADTLLSGAHIDEPTKGGTEE